MTYSHNILTELTSLKPNAKLYYLAMFALTEGINRVRTMTRFGQNSSAVFELDESYKCLSDKSRIMHAAPAHIDGGALRQVATAYGRLLWPDFPVGFDDNQLLLGFHHNTPDNTLPIMWWDGSTAQPWVPAFIRYPKI